MQRRIFTFLVFVLLSQIAWTQIQNNQVFGELEPYSVWTSEPVDGPNGLGEYVIQLEPIFNGTGIDEICLQWTDNSGEAFYDGKWWWFRFGTDATVDFTMRAWESDDSESNYCNVVDQSTLFEANASDYTLGISTVIEMGPPSTWLETLGNADNWLFDFAGAPFDVRVRGIWRYRAGDNCNEPLQFGTLTDNSTVKNSNANRAVIGDINYTNALEYSNTSQNSSADVFYSFTLEEAANVTISTESDATNFDTYIWLYEEVDCVNHIGDNDDYGVNSWSRIDAKLCPGTYVVQVEGFNGRTGDFELSLETEFLDEIVVTDEMVENASCSDSVDGEISINVVSGGFAPYTIAWDNGAVGATITALAVGTYVATITDGCDKEQVVSYTIASDDNIAPELVCNGAALGIVPGQQFNLSDQIALLDFTATDNCSADQDITLTFSPNAFDDNLEGLNSVTLTATDGSGNMEQCTFDVLIVVSPLSDFSFISTADYSYSFTDESQFTPTSWAWDFGDGESSTMQHPDHTFSGPGMYNVCLTAENEAGMNQSCQEILIELSSINDLSNQLNVDIFPNPTNGRFTLNWTGDAPKDALVRIVTINGQVIVENDLLTSGTQIFQLNNQPAGVYMVQIISAEGALEKRIVLQ